jgi:hypothetical protein
VLQRRDGVRRAPYGWSLFLIPALPAAAWLWKSFTRRAEVLELRKRLELRSRIKIREIDFLRWQDFEIQCIALLQLLGYKDVEKTRNLPDEKTIDIRAVNPGTGNREIFECKHKRGGLSPVGAREVNELIGRVASGMYQGLQVTLMTNARVTDRAAEKAARHGINVIDRKKLAELIAQASGQPGNPAPAPHGQDAAAPVAPGVRGLITALFGALRRDEHRRARKAVLARHGPTGQAAGGWHRLRAPARCGRRRAGRSLQQGNCRAGSSRRR